jgi:hypothetical protein
VLWAGMQERKEEAWPDFLWKIKMAEKMLRCTNIFVALQQKTSYMIMKHAGY